MIGVAGRLAKPWSATVPRSWREAGDRAARRILEGFMFIVVPAFLVLVVAFLAPRATYAWDFHPLWQAAGGVVHGANPYTTTGGWNSQGTRYSGFIYPPLVADLLIPLGWLPYLAAALVFMIGSLVAIPVALWLFGVRDWRCYGAVFLWLPVDHGLRLGALTPLLILSIAVAWRYRDSPRVSGLAAAAAVVTKIFLWPLLAWQAGRGRKRSYKALTLSLVALVVVPWATIGFAGLATYPQLLNNESGFWDRGYSVSALGAAMGLPGGPARFATLALALVACAVAVVAQRRDRIDEREALALLILIAIACSPVSWLHYSSLLVVPVALLSPRLSAAWIIPLAFWLTPFEEADGVIWRIVLVLMLNGLITVVSIVGHRSAATQSTSRARFGSRAAPAFVR